MANKLKPRDPNLRPNPIVVEPESPTRILILADLDRMRSFSKLSNNRVRFLEYLNENCPEVRVIENKQLPTPSEDGKPQLHHVFSHLGLSQVPNIIVHYVMGPGAGPVADQILVTGLEKTPLMTCLWVEDSGHLTKLSAILPWFKGVLFSVRQDKLLGEYLIKFPHLITSSLDPYIDASVFRDYGLTKEYDIIFYGYVDKQYPFRARLHKLLQANQKRFKIKFIPHPGYYNLENKRVIAGQNLAQALNSSCLSICTRSTSDLLLKKYLEAPFCNCLPCGDIPTDYRSLFEGKMVELTPEMTDGQIIGHLQKCLKDRQSLLKRAVDLGSALRSHYSYPAGAQAFVTSCQMMWKQFYLQKKPVKNIYRPQK